MGDEWTYRYTAVSANNRNLDVRSQGGIPELLGDKSRSTDDVQSGDTKEPEKFVSR